MRLRKKWWARPEMEASPLVIVDTEKVKGKWQEEFNNDNPIHLELGCGRGKFITDLAEKNPNINYIAIDLKDEILIYVLRAVKEKELTNVRIVPKEIAFIKEVLDKDEIEKIYINFCNPWPKKSHHKRRLTHIRKLNDYKTFLKSDSEVWFKTDDKDLFDASIEYFNQCGFDIKYSTYDLHKSDFKENVITEYENKFMHMGMPIMFLIAVHKNCK